MLSDMVARTLGRHGYRVLTAQNGVEALKVLEREQVDLVLTDVGMPSMGGTKLYEQLRTLHGDLPVVFMTGYGSDGQLPNDYPVLAKPFGTQALLEAVQAAARKTA